MCGIRTNAPQTGRWQRCPPKVHDVMAAAVGEAVLAAAAMLSMTVMHTRENLHDFMLSPCAPVFVHLALKSVTESPEPLEGEGGQAA
ncbi:hypothetical protein QJQ45_027506 [Haematococcus lacustris]|nr:hypothetical protein QJQ45_027506 [Haematococcus lacustris]